MRSIMRRNILNLKRKMSIKEPKMKNYLNTKEKEKRWKSSINTEEYCIRSGENTIMNEDTPVKEVIIEAACKYYIIFMPITDEKEKENWYKKVAR